MLNPEKWKKISKKDIKEFSVDFVEFKEYDTGDGIQKFIIKNRNNLTYYLVESNKNFYIRCFKNYEEIMIIF